MIVSFLKKGSLDSPPNIPVGKDDENQSLKYMKINFLVCLASIV